MRGSTGSTNFGSRVVGIIVAGIIDRLCAQIDHRLANIKVFATELLLDVPVLTVRGTHEGTCPLIVRAKPSFQGPLHRG